MKFFAPTLIAIVVPLMLRWMGRSAASPGQPGRLGYSRKLRWFALLMTLVPTLAVAALGIAAPPGDAGNALAFAGLLGMFLALGIPMVLETHRVLYSFDQAGLTVQSPWSRRRTIAWKDLTRVRWRQLAKWFDLSDGSRVAHVSPLMSGLEDFARVCRDRLSPALQSDANVDAVLRLMKDGRAGELIWASVAPAALVEPQQRQVRP